MVLLTDSVLKFCYLSGQICEVVVSPNMAQSAVTSVKGAFLEGRQKEGVGLLGKWKEYLPTWAMVCEQLIAVLIPPVDNDQPLHETEDGCRWCVNELLGLFGPLVEPPGGLCPPWTQKDSETAAVVLRHLTSSLCTIHRVFERRLPPGLENVPSLFWRYFAEKLAPFKRGGENAHELYALHFIRLPWANFWPHLVAMKSMAELLSDDDSLSRPFLTKVVVRIPWTNLADQYRHQPEDAVRAFHGLLFQIIVRCAVEEKNYAECKASFPQLLDCVSSFDWSRIDETALRDTMDFTQHKLSPSSICTAETDIKTMLFRYIKVACSFRVNPVSAEKEESIRRKQASFVRLSLTLLDRGTKEDLFSKEYACKYFVEMVSHVELITRTKGKPTVEMGLLCREFIEFWNRTESHKVLAGTQKALCEWLLAHPDANVALIFLHVAIPTANALTLSKALSLTETCINAYFLSNAQECTWEKICQWLVVPDSAVATLREEGGEVDGPWLLTLYAHLLRQIPQAQNLKAEGVILDELIKLVVATKRKYLEEEAPLLLVTSKAVELLVRQVQFGETVDDQWTALMEWCAAKSENRHSGLLGMIGLGKKPAFSTKFKLVCQILQLFMQQQKLPNGIRMDPNSPITNSRIQTVQDLKLQKQFAPFANTIELSTAFFKDTGNTFERTGALLGKLIRSLYIERYFNLLL